MLVLFKHGVDMKRGYAISILLVWAVVSGRGYAEEYRLETGDAVRVELLNLSDTPIYEDILDEKGSIDLPYLGELCISNKTTKESELLIAQAYLTRQVFTSLTVRLTRLATISSNRSEILRSGVVRPVPLEPVRQGDFWLPGEYEKELEEKMKERATPSSPPPPDP